MARASLRKELAELLDGLDGWRLEPRTTPGSSPLWCYVSGGKVEFSVSVEGTAILLYVMDTDDQLTFDSRDALMAWLGAHRPEAVRPAPTRPEKKNRIGKFFEWN